MLPIAEINHKIMKLLDFDSYFVLCRVNKYNRQLVCEDTHYQKFQVFHEDWLEEEFSLRLNRDVTDLTFKIHRYKLALEYNCIKLVDRYGIHVYGDRRYSIIESAVKTDNLKLYELTKKKLDLKCDVIYANTVYANTIYKHNLHNFYKKYLANSSRQEIQPSVLCWHNFFKYIYTNNLLHMYDKLLLSNYIIGIMKRHQFLTLPNIIYYIDIIVKIIIKLQIKYDIYTILVRIYGVMSDKRIKRKLEKYIRIHIPKSLRPKQPQV